MLELIISALFALSGLALLAWSWRKIAAAQHLLHEAQLVKDQIKKDLETERREALIRLKDELYKRRTEAEAELKKERFDLDRFQQKLTSRLEVLEKKRFRLMKHSVSCNRKNVIYYVHQICFVRMNSVLKVYMMNLSVNLKRLLL